MFITAYHTVGYLAGADTSAPVSTKTYSGIIKGCAYTLDSVTSVALIIIAVIANDKAHVLISPDLLKKIPIALLIASTKTTGIIWAATSAGSLSIQMVCVLIIDKPKQIHNKQEKTNRFTKQTDQKQEEDNHSPSPPPGDHPSNPSFQTPNGKGISYQPPATEPQHKTISMKIIRRAHSCNSLTNLAREGDLTLSPKTKDISDKVCFKLNTIKEKLRDKFETLLAKKLLFLTSIPKPIITPSGSPIDMERPPQLIVDLATVKKVKKTLKNAKNRNLAPTPRKHEDAMTRFQRSISVINLNIAKPLDDDIEWN